MFPARNGVLFLVGLTGGVAATFLACVELGNVGRAYYVEAVLAKLPELEPKPLNIKKSDLVICSRLSDIIAVTINDIGIAAHNLNRSYENSITVGPLKSRWRVMPLIKRVGIILFGPNEREISSAQKDLQRVRKIVGITPDLSRLLTVCAGRK